MSDQERETIKTIKIDYTTGYASSYVVPTIQ